MGHAIGDEFPPYEPRLCRIPGCQLRESPGRDGYCGTEHRRYGRALVALKRIADGDVEDRYEDRAPQFQDIAETALAGIESIADEVAARARA